MWPCEHPQDLACHLDHVAEIEAARWHAAGHPPSLLEPANLCDLLHHSAVQTWQTLASSQPAPGLEPDQTDHQNAHMVSGRTRIWWTPQSEDGTGARALVPEF